MQAYHLEAFEKIEGILLRKSTKPAPGLHDIVVQVRAASLNRRDIMILEKTYPLGVAFEQVESIMRVGWSNQRRPRRPPLKHKIPGDWEDIPSRRSISPNFSMTSQPRSAY